MNLLSPKGFLQVGGAVLVLVAILGYAGIIGPDADSSMFGSLWYFDGAENIAHLVLGVVALAAAFLLKDMKMQKMLVMLVGILGILVGLYSVIGPVTEGSNLLGAQLQNPTDTLLHFVVGAWALWASMKKVGMMTSPMSSTPPKQW